MTSHEYAGYLCWDPAEVSDDIVPQEAVYPSNAVFAATHNRMRLLRKKFSGVDALDCDEATVLDDLQTPGVTMLFLAIVGESGTGKSHLIRWLGTRLTSDSKRRVVYIKKYNTNLRDVVWEILSGIEGPEFDELRTKIERVTTELSEEEAAKMLIDQLALLTESVKVDEGIDPTRRKPRQLLARQLPNLLRDGAYRTQLLEREAAIPRLVREVFRGRRESDKLAPFEIAPEDLPTAVADIASSGRAAKEIYQSLVGSLPLRQAAAELLNELLERAIGRVLQIGDTSLPRAMKELRALLQQRGQELILLIEDFTLLQGIQRGLLEALIEPAIREGEQHLCTIRTAVAVTTGYFEKLGFETLMTRADFAGYVYNVDQQYGLDVSSAEIAAFVGRYLNAARIGAPALAEAFGKRQKKSAQGWVPNRCAACPFQSKCHDAFGATKDGFGLYPFNEHALDRMVREVGTRGKVFEPRAVLGGIVRQTLAGHAEEIPSGRFPSATYLANFGSRRELPDEVRQRLKDEPDGDQIIALHEYWANDGVVDAGIYEAFKIQPPAIEIDLGTRQTTTEESDEPRATRGGIDKRLKAIEAWRGGGAFLEAPIAREVREAIKDAIATQLVSDLDCWRAVDAEHFGLKQGSVELPRSRGGVAKAPTDIGLKLEDDEGSRSAMRGVVAFSVHGNWGFERGGEALRNYISLVERLSFTVREKLPHDKEPDHFQLVFLLAGGLVGGTERMDAADDATLMRSLFAEPNRTASTIGDEWDSLVDHFCGGTTGGPSRSAAQDDLRSIYGASQGDGRPQLIDATAILPILRQQLAAWATVPSLPDPVSVKLQEHVTRLQRDWSDTRAMALRDFGSEISVADLRAELGLMADLARRLQVFSAESEFARAMAAFASLGPVTRATIDAMVDQANTKVITRATAALADIGNRRIFAALRQSARLAERCISAISDRASSELSAGKSDPTSVEFQKLREALSNIDDMLSSV